MNKTSNKMGNMQFYWTVALGLEVLEEPVEMINREQKNFKGNSFISTFSPHPEIKESGLKSLSDSYIVSCIWLLDPLINHC